MRQKRYKSIVKKKHKRLLAVGLMLLIGLLIFFNSLFPSQSYSSAVKFRSYLSVSEDITTKYEQLKLFLSEIVIDQEKMDAFLSMNFSEETFVNQLFEVKETIGVPFIIDMQDLLTDEKIVYLTFDDGPTPYTKEIIDLLDRYDLKATFFMLEPRMRKYPESLKYLIHKGHQPALHGVTHRLDHFYENKESLIRELDISNQTLFELGGINSYIIRTPYGSFPHMTEEYFSAVYEHGYYLFDWTIDSLDWKYPNEKFVWYTIQQLENIRELNNRPKVILLHDRVSTAEHLEKLLIYLKENGYVTDIIDYRYYGYSF